MASAKALPLKQHARPNLQVPCIPMQSIAAAVISVTSQGSDSDNIGTARIGYQAPEHAEQPIDSGSLKLVHM